MEELITKRIAGSLKHSGTTARPRSLAMVIFSNGNPQTESLAVMAERLSSLAVDLRAIADGRLPEELVTGSTPVLDRWSRTLRPSVCLQGLVSDHPVLPGEDRAIRTSQVWYLDQEARWARTYSRWYRLSVPAAGLF